DNRIDTVQDIFRRLRRVAIADHIELVVVAIDRDYDVLAAFAVFDLFGPLQSGSFDVSDPAEQMTAAIIIDHGGADRFLVQRPVKERLPKGECRNHEFGRPLHYGIAASFEQDRKAQFGINAAEIIGYAVAIE